MRRNAGLLFIARIVSAGTTLIVLALVSRLREPEALGAMGVGFALGAVGAVLTDLGIGSLLVREVARRPEAAPHFLGAGLAVRAVTVPLSLLAAWLAATVIAPGAESVVVLTAAGLILQQTAELTRSGFLAHQRVTVSSAHSALENLAWLIVMAVGLVSGMALDSVLLAALVVWIGSVLAGLGLLRVILRVAPALPTRREITDMVRMAGPFAGFGLVAIASTRGDTLLISLLLSGPALAAAGVYFAASRLIASFEYVPDAVSRAMYPELARRTVARSADVVPLLGSAAAVLVAIGAAVPAVLVPGGEWLMRTLFGEVASAEAWVLGALALAVPIRYLGYLYGTTLTSADAQGRRLAAAACALAFVGLVNVIGIPLIGVAASVIGSFGAACIVVVLYASFVQRRFGGIGLVTRDLVAAGAAAAVAVGAGLLLRPSAGEVVASVAAGATYLALLTIGPAGGTLRRAVRGAAAT